MNALRDARAVVVLGGGLTGLSASFHLDGVPRLVLERDAEPMRYLLMATRTFPW